MHKGAINGVFGGHIDMPVNSNNEYIINCLSSKQVSLVGFADLSVLDDNITNGLCYGVCIAVALKVFPSMGEQPSIDYYHEVNDVNKYLKEISFYLEEKIKQKGFDAYALAREKQNEQFRTPLPFKTLATRAGLGWIGKSAALITKEYGNAVRLNGVITNMPFETGSPVEHSYCGTCSECVNMCPAKAIKGINWEPGADRDELLNPYECKAKVIERGKIFNVTQCTCGICIGACPWTQKYIKKHLSEGTLL